MRIAVFALLLAVPVSAIADLETDRNAGICAAYLTARKIESGAQAALNMADNQKRATQFGLNWMRDLKRYQDQNNKSAVEGAIYQASSACRKVGIRPADFK